MRLHYCSMDYRTICSNNATQLPQDERTECINRVELAECLILRSIELYMERLFYTSWWVRRPNGTDESSNNDEKK